jgi:hypothetical protein
MNIDNRKTDNIKMDLKEIGWGGMPSIGLDRIEDVGGLL